MKYREQVHKRQDRAIYSHTAEKTKKINILPKVSRGGIRL